MSFLSIASGPKAMVLLAPILGLIALACGGGSDAPTLGAGTGSPVADATSAPLATPTPRLHVVASGDNLSALCDATVPELPLADCLDRAVRLNNLASASQIQVGLQLILPEDPGARISPGQLALAPATPLPATPAGPRPTPTPVADRCGAPPNPYNFSFCETGGSVIVAPPEDICDYLTCTDAFWEERGFIVQCNDGVFSKAGGSTSVCLERGGAARALMTP